MDEKVGGMKKMEGRKSWVDEKIGWIKKGLLRAKDAPLLAAPSFSVSISFTNAVICKVLGYITERFLLGTLFKNAKYLVS